MNKHQRVAPNTPVAQGGELGDNEVQWPVSLPYSPMMGWSTRAQPRSLGDILEQKLIHFWEDNHDTNHAKAVESTPPKPGREMVSGYGWDTLW